MDNEYSATELQLLQMIERMAKELEALKKKVVKLERGGSNRRTR